MPIISADLTHAGGRPTADELEAKLLAGQTLLAETANHVMQVVDVLESYGEVLDAYSTNLIYQAEHQFLNPLPAFRYLDEWRVQGPRRCHRLVVELDRARRSRESWSGDTSTHRKLHPLRSTRLHQKVGHRCCEGFRGLSRLRPQINPCLRGLWNYLSRRTRS
ncbi:CO2 hydration protein [Aestuariivirga sp.]|uniref:CO2 hydration protein n=1 Tax=Aestuariivirga sp. TaxID=2650926 RepID=UPI00301A3BBA